MKSEARQSTRWAFVGCLLWAAASAGPAKEAAEATGARRELTRVDLTGTARLEHLPSMQAFQPAAGATRPAHRFEGRLTLVDPARHGEFREIKDSFEAADASDGAYKHLPDFEFDFVQAGEHLIPAERGPIPSAHPAWEYILEPGRVWNEAADGDFSRAALPFALQERNANCIHNGVLTFLFRADGSVSRAAYVIASETCMYLQFDAWGVLPAQYAPRTVGNGGKIISAYELELASRLPTRPIAALAHDYPRSDPKQFGAPSETPPESLTTFGFVIDGINYVGGCPTRAGPYPFCDVLPLPSYSLAKSILAGVAWMRLEQLAPGAGKRTIASLVPECVSAERWGDVSIENALDMASGNFASREGDADEWDSYANSEFFATDGHAQKVAIACTRYPRKSEPGSTWVYHTTDTYLAGAAMNAYWREKQGPQADLYRDLLVEQLWKPLHLSPLMLQTRRTYDAARQPFSGWGLTFLRDDIARVALFLSEGKGRIAGQQLLDPKALGASLQRVASDRGLAAWSKDFRYNNGFWGHDVQAYLGCRQPTWVPYLSGYGGISVLLIPNGTIYYVFGDSGVHRWRSAAQESNRLRPYCRN